MHELLVIYSAFVRYWGKMEKDYDSEENLYNILIKIGIAMKLDRLISMCLNETCNKVHTDKNLSDAFPIQSDLKKRRYMTSTLQLYFGIWHQEYPIKS
jgi:hypothetical protein